MYEDQLIERSRFSLSITIWFPMCYLLHFQKHCNDQVKKMDKMNEIIREDQADLQQLKEMVENFVVRANSF